MTGPGFRAREGGVTVVFDVAESAAEHVMAVVGAAGFDVRRYYPDGATGPGRPAPGRVRLGAERPLHEFTEAEQSRIVADFDGVQAGFDCDRVGVDVWTAGDGPAGVREPRRPEPRQGAGAAARS